jgi:hypothetical protein
MIIMIVMAGADHDQNKSYQRARFVRLWVLLILHLLPRGRERHTATDVLGKVSKGGHELYICTSKLFHIFLVYKTNPTLDRRDMFTITHKREANPSDFTPVLL